MAFTCEKCSKTLRRGIGDWQYRESGLPFVTLINCVRFLCSECGYVMPLLPDIQKAKFPISIQLLTHTGRVTGPILRFFRKAIGLTADEFATLIGTTRVEVSRWENGHVQMSGLRELQVRLEIADKLLPSGPEAARIREEVIMVMTRRYDPSAHVEGIEVDARHCYPQGTDAPPVQDEVAVYT